MSRPPGPFTREEEGLAEMLAASREPHLVIFTEPFHPGSQATEGRLRTLAERSRRFHVVAAGYEGFRHFARLHRVFGTPAVLLFQNGEMVRRFHGTFTEEEWEEMLGFGGGGET